MTVGVLALLINNNFSFGRGVFRGGCLLDWELTSWALPFWELYQGTLNEHKDLEGISLLVCDSLWLESPGLNGCGTVCVQATGLELSCRCNLRGAGEGGTPDSRREGIGLSLCYC